MSIEKTDSKLKVPRLMFSQGYGEKDFISSRSDFDELAILTSFREKTNDQVQENLEEQIDRLNQILESVIGSIGCVNESSFLLPKARENSVDFSILKENPNNSVLNNLMNDKKEISEYINQLIMKINDLESLLSHQSSIKSKLNRLEKYLSASGLLKKFSNLQLLLSSSGAIPKIIEEEKSDRVLTEKTRENNTDFHSFYEEKIKEYTFTIEVYKQFFSSLCSQLSNLTSFPLKFNGDFPEIELPNLVFEIVKLVSSVKSREKDIELKEKSISSLDFKEKLQVACTYDEVISVQERISEIVNELNEYRNDMEYTIKVGLLSIGINVYFPDDCQAKYYALPLFSDHFYGLHNPSYHERSDSLLKARPPVSQIITDRNLELKDSCYFMQDLEEKVVELNRKIINMEEIREMEEEMNFGIESAAESRIQELETLVDQQKFEINVLKKQLEQYKKGSFTHEFSSAVNYSQKMQDLREKEKFMKVEYEKLELEKQKLIKHTISLYSSKQRSPEFNDRFFDSGMVVEESKIIQCKTKEIATSPIKKANYDINIYDTDNITLLTQQLHDTYTKLESSQCEENPDQLIDDIRKIKKRINEIQTKQALMFTEKTIDYAEKKLGLIEKEIGKGSKYHYDSFEEKNSERLQQVILRNERLEKNVRELQELMLKDNDFDHEKAKVIRDRVVLQQKEEKIYKKRALLKQKILQINNRQKKIMEIEEMLNEKKNKMEARGKGIKENNKTLEDFKENVEVTPYSNRSKKIPKKLIELEVNALKTDGKNNQLDNLKKKINDSCEKLNKKYNYVY